MSKVQPLLLGAVATLAVAELFHGPLGRAQELKVRIESSARQVLDANELTQVQARLAEQPMRRVLILSGPADEFQRGELVRVLGQLPGVGGVEWDPGSLPVEIKLPPGPPVANVAAPPIVPVPEGR